jgi:hypothetical protein
MEHIARGVDFSQARSEVIKSIRSAIKNHEDSRRIRNILSFSDEESSLTLLGVPALCCVLLVVSLASRSTHYISGLLVSLLVIVAVVTLNICLCELASSAESNEIRRELEKILNDYEAFSNRCTNYLFGGTNFTHFYVLFRVFRVTFLSLFSLNLRVVIVLRSAQNDTVDESRILSTHGPLCRDASTLIHDFISNKRLLSCLCLSHSLYFLFSSSLRLFLTTQSTLLRLHSTRLTAATFSLLLLPQI